MKKFDKTAEADAAQTKQILLVLGGVGLFLVAVLGLFIAFSLSGSLTSIISQVSNAGSQIISASQQLSSASQQLSAGSTESASSLEETVASLEELTSMVKLNADHAKEAASLSQTSRQAAERGEAEISKLISAMDEIATGSRKVSEIINVIDDIAFQTNLLALNAFDCCWVTLPNSSVCVRSGRGFYR